jgi:hypothetical protein
MTAKRPSADLAPAANNFELSSDGHAIALPAGGALIFRNLSLRECAEAALDLLKNVGKAVKSQP